MPPLAGNLRAEVGSTIAADFVVFDLGYHVFWNFGSSFVRELWFKGFSYQGLGSA